MNKSAAKQLYKMQIGPLTVYKNSHLANRLTFLFRFCSSVTLRKHQYEDFASFKLYLAGNYQQNELQFKQSKLVLHSTCVVNMQKKVWCRVFTMQNKHDQDFKKIFRILKYCILAMQLWQLELTKISSWNWWVVYHWLFGLDTAVNYQKSPFKTSSNSSTE